mgnify:CR=1 FL=1
MYIKKVVCIMFVIIISMQMTACDYIDAIKEGILETEETTAVRSTVAPLQKGSYTPVEETSYRMRNLLTDNQKSAYEKIERAVFYMDDNASLGKVTIDDVSLAYNAVMDDYPQYFWMSKEYSYLASSNGNMKIFFKNNNGKSNTDYLVSEEQREGMQQKFNAAVQKALGKLTVGMSEYERELVLHDYLVENVTYDQATADETKEDNLSYTAYNALVTGTAVCDGYTRAYQLLLYYAGIENGLVYGTADKIGHIWNVVKINGKWYHVDSTWNDTSDAGYHAYFNVTDNYIKADHEIGKENMSLPVCNSTERNYGVVNKTYITSNAEFETVIKEAMKRSIPKGINKLQFIFGENYNRTLPEDLAKFSSTYIEPVIKQYNKEVEKKYRVKEFWVGGIKGSKAFLLEKNE